MAKRVWLALPLKRSKLRACLCIMWTSLSVWEQVCERVSVCVLHTLCIWIGVHLCACVCYVYVCVCVCMCVSVCVGSGRTFTLQLLAIANGRLRINPNREPGLPLLPPYCCCCYCCCCYYCYFCCCVGCNRINTPVISFVCDGTQTDYGGCMVDETRRCSHSVFGIYLTCGEPQLDVPIRLTNGSSGFFEVFIYGEWGTVIGSNVRADRIVTNMVCRWFGYDVAAVTASLHPFGSKSGRIWLSAYCEGDENSILECPIEWYWFSSYNISFL